MPHALMAPRKIPKKKVVVKLGGKILSDEKNSETARKYPMEKNTDSITDNLVLSALGMSLYDDNDTIEHSVDDHQDEAKTIIDNENIGSGGQEQSLSSNPDMIEVNPISAKEDFMLPVSNSQREAANNNNNNNNVSEEQADERQAEVNMVSVDSAAPNKPSTSSQLLNKRLVVLNSRYPPRTNNSTQYYHNNKHNNTHRTRETSHHQTNHRARRSASPIRRVVRSRSRSRSPNKRSSDRRMNKSHSRTRETQLRDAKHKTSHSHAKRDSDRYDHHHHHHHRRSKDDKKSARHERKNRKNTHNKTRSRSTSTSSSTSGSSSSSSSSVSSSSSSDISDSDDATTQKIKRILLALKKRKRKSSKRKRNHSSTITTTNHEKSHRQNSPLQVWSGSIRSSLNHDVSSNSRNQQGIQQYIDRNMLSVDDGDNNKLNNKAVHYLSSACNDNQAVTHQPASSMAQQDETKPYDKPSDKKDTNVTSHIVEYADRSRDRYNFGRSQIQKPRYVHISRNKARKTYISRFGGWKSKTNHDMCDQRYPKHIFSSHIQQNTSQSTTNDATTDVIHSPSYSQKRIVLKRSYNNSSHVNSQSESCVAIVRPGLESLFRTHAPSFGFQIFDYAKTYQDASALILAKSSFTETLATLLESLLSEECLYTRFYHWVQSRLSLQNHRFVIFNPTPRSQSSISKLCSIGAVLIDSEDEISHSSLSTLPHSFYCDTLPQTSSLFLDDERDLNDYRDTMMNDSMYSTVMPREGWSSRVKNYKNMVDVVVVLLGEHTSQSVSVFTDCGFDIYNEMWAYEKAAQCMLTNTMASVHEIKQFSLRVRNTCIRYFSNECSVSLTAERFISWWKKRKSGCKLLHTVIYGLHEIHDLKAIAQLQKNGAIIISPHEFVSPCEELQVDYTFVSKSDLKVLCKKLIKSQADQFVLSLQCVDNESSADYDNDDDNDPNDSKSRNVSDYDIEENDDG